MKKNKGISRRDFLMDGAAASMFLPAVDTVFASLLSTALRSPQAHAANPFKKFIHLNLYAAPPRWMYDLFLNPANDTANFVPSKQVTNRYTGTGPNYIDANYQLVRYGASGPYVPWLWNQDVPRSTGGTLKANALLANMLNIRGIDVLNSAHIGAAELHQTAVIGSPTISSMTADQATSSPTDPTLNLIRAISLNGAPGNFYRSAQGSTQFGYNTTGNNDLASLFASFTPVSVSNGFNATFVNNRGELNDRIQAAINALQPGARRYYQSVLASSDSSMKILSGDTVQVFSQLSTEWNDLFGKYKDLITRTLGMTYVGINDKRIGREPANAAEAKTYQYGSNVTAQNKVGGNVDLRDMLSAVNFNGLAAQFAVTEFLASKNLSPSISVQVRAPSNIRLNNGTTGFTFDQHFVGRMPGIYLNTMFYLAYTSCVLELIRVLKANNQFNDTLIYMASEFNRSARADGSGADHGAKATHVSLISGRISSFKIIGNIYKDSAGTNLPYGVTYKGTWGAGAPLAGAPLNIVQIWSSVMRLLGMPLPVIPNVVDKSRLLFNETGSFAIKAAFNKAPVNVSNVSR